MSNFASSHGNLFARTFTAVAILSPILLVTSAGTLPEGLSQRGALVVNGSISIVAVLAVALVFRLVYQMGFAQARRLRRSAEQHSITTA